MINEQLAKQIADKIIQSVYDDEQKFILDFPQYKDILRKLDDHQPTGMNWMVECPTGSNNYLPLLNPTKYRNTGVINYDCKC